MRVSPPRIFPHATRAAKPPMGADGSADAFRQLGFVLGDDVELVLQGLNLEGAVAEASSAAKYRTQKMVSALGLWSRSWLSRLEALHAVEWGNYVGALPLIRAAADYQAAALYLLHSQAVEWEEWLAAGGIALAPDEHATEYRLHAFRAAEVLAAHEILGPVYRAATDLSLSHFGSTLMLTGSDSTPDRVLMTFGDRDFHLGLAELELGWLLQLAVAQGEALVEFTGVFAINDRAALEAFCGAARARVADPARCGIEQIERGGEVRYLVHNWRRAPGAAAKRLLL
ncbi:MAG: hypothetical protein ACRDG3_02085 [Tepidiformaceae bacterium]